MGEMTGKWEQRRSSQDFTTALLPPSPSRQLNLQIGSNLFHIYMGWGWVGVNFGYWINDPHLCLMFMQFSPCVTLRQRLLEPNSKPIQGK